MDRAIYLDHNATQPVRPAAAAAAAEAMAEVGNPSSVHRFGRLARRRVEQARERVATLVGAVPAAVVFTSGGTEANTLALYGFPGRRILVGATEHDSILNAAPDATRIQVGPDGVIDLTALDRALAAEPGPALVSIQAANNETGVIQPIVEIAGLVHRYGALLHTDAVQAAARLPFDLRTLRADLLTLSGHKLGGPMGAGALVLREGLDLRPWLRGGGQERGLRAGTENVPGIAGLGAAAELAALDRPGMGEVERLREELEERILDAVPSASILGKDAPRLPNTCCVAMPGVSSETQVMALDLAGIAISAGSACSSGKVRRSHVLVAMGVAAEIAESAIRISLGTDSRPEHIDRFVEGWAAIFARSGGERRRTAAR